MPAGHDLLDALGHEEVLLWHDRETGLRAIVAILDTTLGPAVGGTRMAVPLLRPRAPGRAAALARDDGEGRAGRDALRRR